MKTRLMLWLMLFCCSCAVRPDPRDVQADRARWTAVRDATADGSIDEQEGPLVAELLVAWDAKLSADEAAAGAQRDARAILEDLLRAYGVAAVQLWLVPEMQQRAPEMLRLIDRDGDGTLTAAELLAIDPADPVFALVVATTAQQLLRRR